MPRPPRRVFFEYSCYHVITRGNRKQKIFLRSSDFRCYLSMLKKAKRKYRIRLYGYCLMPNHVHLLIEASSIENMARFMCWMNRGYTAYFNCKYNKIGHLWQGRYKSKPIIKGRYLVHCSQYIEGNPVRAELGQDILDYPWSSYKERCLIAKRYILDDIDLEGTTLKSEKVTG